VSDGHWLRPAAPTTASAASLGPRYAAVKLTPPRTSGPAPVFLGAPKFGTPFVGRATSPTVFRSSVGRAGSPTAFRSSVGRAISPTVFRSSVGGAISPTVFRSSVGRATSPTVFRSSVGRAISPTYTSGHQFFGKHPKDATSS